MQAQAIHKSTTGTDDVSNRHYSADAVGDILSHVINFTQMNAIQSIRKPFKMLKTKHGAQ